MDVHAALLAGLVQNLYGIEPKAQGSYGGQSTQNSSMISSPALSAMSLGTETDGRLSAFNLDAVSEEGDINIPEAIRQSQDAEKSSGVHLEFEKFKQFLSTLTHNAPSANLVTPELSGMRSKTPIQMVGPLTRAERDEKIRRYLEKKKSRRWSRSVRYECRKSLADRRLRIQGRFVKNSDVESLQSQIAVSASTSKPFGSSKNREKVFHLEYRPLCEKPELLMLAEEEAKRSVIPEVGREEEEEESVQELNMMAAAADGIGLLDGNIDTAIETEEIDMADPTFN